MVPVPVPVLSFVGSTIQAVRAALNASSGPGGTADPSDIVQLLKTAVTVCVSVRSGSVKANVPFVSSPEMSGPPETLVPPENAMDWVSLSVVMTGTSLVPVTVIVKFTAVFKSSGA